MRFDISKVVYDANKLDMSGRYYVGKTIGKLRSAVTYGDRNGLVSFKGIDKKCTGFDGDGKSWQFWYPYTDMGKGFHPYAKAELSWTGRGVIRKDSPSESSLVTHVNANDDRFMNEPMVYVDDKPYNLVAFYETFWWSDMTPCGETEEVLE